MVLKIKSDRTGWFDRRPITVSIWSDQLDRETIEPELNRLNRRPDRRTGPVLSRPSSSFSFPLPYAVGTPFPMRLVPPLSP